MPRSRPRSWPIAAAAAVSCPTTSPITTTAEPSRCRNASYQSPPTRAASAAGTYRTTTAASAISGGSVSRLRWSASASWACWFCRCTRSIARPGLGGHLPQGLQVVVGHVAARVLVQREDADGPLLRGQRDDHRRLRAQGLQDAAGRPRGHEVQHRGHRLRRPRCPTCSARATGEASGSVSSRISVYRSSSGAPLRVGVPGADVPGAPLAVDHGHDAAVGERGDDELGQPAERGLAVQGAGQLGRHRREQGRARGRPPRRPPPPGRGR